MLAHMERGTLKNDTCLLEGFMRGNNSYKPSKSNILS